MTNTLYVKWFNSAGVMTISNPLKIGIDYDPEKDTETLFNEFYRRINSI
jgi:hypothetical protein